MYDVVTTILQWMINKSSKNGLFKALKAIKKTDVNAMFPLDTALELFQQFDYDKRTRDNDTTLLGTFYKKQSILQFEKKSIELFGNQSYVPVTYIPTKQNTDLIEIYVDHVACCFWQMIISFQEDNKDQPILDNEIIPYFLMYVQSIYSHERFHRLMSLILDLHNNKDTEKNEISEGLATAFSYHHLMFLAVKPTGKMRVFSKARMEQLILNIMPSDPKSKYRLWQDYVDPMRFMLALDKSLKISSHDILFGKWKYTNLKDFIFIIEPWINWNVRERTRLVELRTGNDITDK